MVPIPRSASEKRIMIAIQRNGETLGPYDAAQIVALVKTEQLAGTDLAWSSAMKKWEPLACSAEFSRLFTSPRNSTASNVSFVRTLCILTIMGSVLGVLRGLFYEAVATTVGSSPSFWRGWAYVVLNAGTLIGAMMMLARRVDGFYIYTACQFLYLLVVGYATFIWSQDTSLFFVLVGASFFLPSLVFLALYWLPGNQHSIR